MRIAVLTSSRADYGIYKSLLSKLYKDKRFELTIIVFGMHLQSEQGKTVNRIIKDYNNINIHEILGMPAKDSQYDISKGYGNLVIEFSKYWNKNNYDLVLALGDRFEMSAAVQASIPFGVDIAHIHGGETTLGAIDNIYRHQLSLASKIHFTTSDEFSKRVIKLIGETKNVYNVGSLSLDDFEYLKLPKWTDVCKEFNLPNLPFILVTFHPETVNSDMNKEFTQIIKKTLLFLSKKIHIIITLSNADTNGSLYRSISMELNQDDNISLVNTFGKLNYFSAMKNSKFLLGNTSSGIIEAASFNKFVINVGDRQKGRLAGENVFHIPYDFQQIIDKSINLISQGNYMGGNLYVQKNTSSRIIDLMINFKR